MSGFGFRIGISLALAGQSMVFGLGYNNALAAGEAPAPGTLPYLLLHGTLLLSSLAVVLLLGRPLLRQTASALAGRRLTVESLFVLSGFGALAGSLLSSIRGEGSVYYEVVAIVLCVYAIGKQLGVVQKGKVGRALAIHRQAFDTAVVERGGDRVTVPVGEVTGDDRVAVGPGEPIPVDGVIRSGNGYIRETALTGEPVPVSKGSGQTVLAGTWSVDGNFIITPNPVANRTIDRIHQLLEAAPARVSNLQASADRLMQLFVPVVSLTAAGTFLGWLLLGGGAWWDALFNAMAVLLVACPCALGLAMPAGIWGGLYYLGERGLMGRNGHLIDVLADCRRVVFDKTGTLSEFELEIDSRFLCPDNPERDGVLSGVASLAAASSHPVSQTLSRLSGERLPVAGFLVYPGQGLGGLAGGNEVIVGEATLLRQQGVEVPPLPPHGGKPVHVAMAGAYMGAILLKECLRKDAAASIQALRSMGIEVHILSGDPVPLHPAVAGVPVESGLSPAAKAERIRHWRSAGKRILFVGDGINDLPAMEASDSALAIDIGAALATEYADGLLVGGRVGVLPGAIRHARRLKQSLNGNVRFALVYNLAGMSLAAAGLLHPVVAALLMVGSSAIVAYRALRVAGLRG